MGFRSKTPTIATAYDLVDKDYAKSIIGQFTVGHANYNDQDDLIGYLISAASLVCAWERDYRYEQKTEIFNGNSASRIIHVDCPPMDANKTVSVWEGRNTSYEFDDDHKLTEHEHYEIWHEEGKIEFWYILTDGLRNYQIQYWGGYQSGQVPQDLMLACALIVADMYKLPEDRRHGLLSKGANGLTTSYTQDMIPKRALAILNHYWRKTLVG